MTSSFTLSQPTMQRDHEPTRGTTAAEERWISMLMSPDFLPLIFRSLQTKRAFKYHISCAKKNPPKTGISSVGNEVPSAGALVSHRCCSSGRHFTGPSQSWCVLGKAAGPLLEASVTPASPGCSLSCQEQQGLSYRNARGPSSPKEPHRDTPSPMPEPLQSCLGRDRSPFPAAAPAPSMEV